MASGANSKAARTKLERRAVRVIVLVLMRSVPRFDEKKVSGRLRSRRDEGHAMGTGVNPAQNSAEEGLLALRFSEKSLRAREGLISPALQYYEETP